MNKNTSGTFGEEKAVDFLKTNGYEILARNYAIRVGEIDIVAKKDGYLCFVEVKTRANDKFATAREAVTADKQNKIRITAEHYILHNSKDLEEGLQPRFDCVEIYTDTDKINYIENAF